MAQTQVSYHLSIVAIQNGDDTNKIGIVPIVQLTSLIFLLWQVSRFVSSIQFEVATVTGELLYLVEALKMAGSVYLTIAGIVTKSILWGLL